MPLLVICQTPGLGPSVDCQQMDLVSSFVMLVTSRMAARASIYKYPVVRPV